MKIKGAILLAVSGILIAGFVFREVSASVPGIITTASLNSIGDQVVTNGSGNSISGDGRYILFYSADSSLTPGYTNNGNIFVRDTADGTTTLVSASNADPAVPANNGVNNYYMSYDGRHVVFSSSATNLVSATTNGKTQIFERDIDGNTTSLISSASDGTVGDGNSDSPAVTADGRFVVFRSASTNLVSGDSSWQVYLKDVSTGGIRILSANSSGLQGNEASFAPSISCDGGVVAFESGATNLISGEAEGGLFVDVLAEGNNDLTNVTLGANGGSSSTTSAVSCDGNDVAFSSAASNLVSVNTNGDTQVYEYDRLKHMISLASVTSSGDAGNNSSDAASISDDGRFIAFQTQASNLGGSSGATQIDVRDAKNNTTQTTSVNNSQVVGNGSSYEPTLSADGSAVAFESYATNLVSGTTAAPETYEAQTGF